MTASVSAINKVVLAKLVRDELAAKILVSLCTIPDKYTTCSDRAQEAIAQANVFFKLVEGD